MASLRCHYVQQQHGTVCVLCNTMAQCKHIVIHLSAAAPRSISTLIVGEYGYNKDDELHVDSEVIISGGGKGAREGGCPGGTLHGAAFKGPKLDFWRLHCNVLT